MTPLKVLITSFTKSHDPPSMAKAQQGFSPEVAALTQQPIVFAGSWGSAWVRVVLGFRIYLNLPKPTFL